jgi:protoporphyrin/coproporphyrin ferrochelatase
MTTPAPSSVDLDRSADVPVSTTTGVDRVTGSYDAVLLASFGGPEGQDDVLPFLRNVTAGRGIPDERLEEVAVHYRANGGVSPINAQNRALQQALEAEIARRGLDLPVYWGNRNWGPYLSDAVRAAHADGKRKLLGLATSAFSSFSGCRQYREDFGQVLADTGLGDEVEIAKIRSYFNHEGFLRPVLDGLLAGLAELRAAGHESDAVRVLFATHSIPDSMADASGPSDTRRSDAGGWYVAQHLAAIRWVMDEVRGALGDDTPAWEFVFQSRSGSPRTPWLEPDIGDAIEEIAEDGVATAVAVVPIGFVSDHMEVVWDLDTEAKEIAEARGLGFVRTATAGTDPRFVAALVDLLQERLEETFPVRHVTSIPPLPDVCGTECCRVRLGAPPQRPTTSATDSAEDAAVLAGGPR